MCQEKRKHLRNGNQTKLADINQHINNIAKFINIHYLQPSSFFFKSKKS